MNISEAISSSNSGLALNATQKAGRILLAMRTSSGVRIVRSYTDPTVVRKLTSEEKLRTNWEPVEVELGQ